MEVHKACVEKIKNRLFFPKIKEKYKNKRQQTTNSNNDRLQIKALLRTVALLTSSTPARRSPDDDVHKVG